MSNHQAVRIAVYTVMAVALGSNLTRGDRLYVKPDGSPSGDCRGRWEAACTLQRALNISVSFDGDEIWVQRGRYTPQGPESFSLVIKKKIKLYGGFVGNETDLMQRPRDPDPFTADPVTDSVLSGDLDSNDDITSSAGCVDGPTWDSWARPVGWVEGVGCLDVDGFRVRHDGGNSRHVVVFEYGTNLNGTRLDGFTITRGYSDVEEYSGGGGILFRSQSAGPTEGEIWNCSILQNRATNGDGGGIFAHGSLTVEGDPQVIGGRVRLVNTVIAENSLTPASYDGGGVFMHAMNQVEFINCQVVNNRSWHGGGGLYLTKIGDVQHSAGAHVINSIVSRNVAGPLSTYYWEGLGGGILMTGREGFPALTLSNSTVAFNRVRGNFVTDGGGVYLGDQAKAFVNNSVIAENVAASTSIGRQFRTMSTVFQPVKVNFSNIQRWDPNEIAGTIIFEGTGNLGTSSSHATLFVDPDGADNKPETYADNDYRLMGTSPGIDAADNTLVPPDVADLDGDNPELEHTPLDLGGYGRFVNAAAEDTGETAGALYDGGPTYPAIADMGAYEFQGCTADTDCPDYVACDGAPRCESGQCVDDFRIVRDSTGNRSNRFLNFSVRHPVTHQPFAMASPGRGGSFPVAM